MFRPHSAPRRRSEPRRGLRTFRRRLQPAVDALEGRQLMAAALTATSVPLNPAPVEGASFTGIVATFTDADKNTDPTAYAVAINWGDGQTSQGTVSVDPKGGFDISGTHTYAAPGAFRITAQVGDKDSDATSISTTNVVGEAAITATGTTINAAQGKPLSNVLVGTFTDADTALGASAFSATINWGDGHTSAGKVVTNKSGGFNVLGSHVYAASGAYAVKVSIQQGRAGEATQFFTESDLISDGAVAADHVDPLLVNPWGLVAGAGGPFWDSNNGTGTSSLYDGAGNVSTGLPFVTVPAPAGSPAGTTSAPTGIVNNSTPNFIVSFTNSSGVTTSGPAAFIFATEDGTISGWNPKVSPTGSSPSVQAILEVDNSASGAVYKGLADVTMAAGDALPAGQYLFATNFHSGNIDVFNSSFQPVSLPAGAFHDATIPAGFAPFGIATIGGDVYVSYAKQDAAKHDDVAGAGNGYVDVYSPTGALLMRLGGPGFQPELNSPWGMVQAPSNFGAFSNDILVGNFGDSHISAFNPTTGAFLGQLSDAQGHPLTLDGGIKGADTKGLWGLSFGNGNGSGNTNTLYFNSGFNDESDGLFGSLTASSVATATAVDVASVALAQGHPQGGSTAGSAVIMAPVDYAMDSLIGETNGAHHWWE